MQEDKHFKDLVQLAVEETSPDFSVNVMQRIEAAYASEPTSKPLLSDMLLRVLSGAFILIFVVLVAISLSMHPELPFRVNVQIPVTYFSQITWFIIVFWVVMLVNHFLNSNQRKHNSIPV